MKYISFVVVSLMACASHAADFDVSLAATRSRCAGLSRELSDLKRMAGINTAITGVGTAAATGATVVGIAKASVDRDLRAILARVDETKGTTENPPADAVMSVYDNADADIKSEQSELYNKSKKLGAWRTGLLGAGAVTNIAGAVIAANNKVDGDLQSRIDECIAAVDSLKTAMAQARIDGADTAHANKIATACGEWKYADLSVINNRARGAMISSIVGATTGAVGTVTSASANTDATRSDADKEKTLNTASNVLAGGTAVASGVATIFNATQIAAVKKIVKIADECEAALQ